MAWQSRSRGAAVALALAGVTLALVPSPAESRERETRGGWLLYVDAPAGRASSEIAVASADGTTRRLLTRNRVADNAAVWSPDGTRIAFVRGVGTASELYSVRFDGTGLRRLTTNRVPDTAPAWSPDGRVIAFLRGRGAASEVFTLRAGGGGLRRLTRNRVAETWAGWTPVGPAPWSRSGARLLVLRGVVGDWGQRRLFSISLATGASRPIITKPVAQALWLPNGREAVALAYDDGGNHDVLLADARNGNVRRLGSEPAGCVSPLTRDDLTVAPSGLRVALDDYPENCTYVIDVFGVRTPAQAVVHGGPGTTGDAKDAYGPSFSPVGARLAFVTSLGNEDTKGTVDEISLVVASADGTDARVVARGEAYSAGCTPPPPTWSPDGRTIAWVVACWGPVHVVDAEAGRPPVVVSAAADWAASWRPAP